MAKKTSTKTMPKKSVAGKNPAAKTPVVPEVVLAIRNIAGALSGIANVPSDLSDAQAKLVGTIDKFSLRVAKTLAGAGKKAEKEAAKAKRANAKKDREVAKRAKKIAARDALRKKLAEMEKELEG